MNFDQIGRSTLLREGGSKVRGEVRYTADVRLPDMLHARLVTSPHAHAAIREIDVKEALRVPGVIAALTATDLSKVVASSRHRLLLARNRVMFVGQPVVLVLAVSEAIAQDGADRVIVAYDPLIAAVTIDDALAPDAPVVWPEGVPCEPAVLGDNLSISVGTAEASPRASNIGDSQHIAVGDPAVGLAEADVVVERTFTTSMVHQGYLETQVTLVQPDTRTGGVTIWASTQAPFMVREQLAALLNVSESVVHVIAMPVGGGFGGKFLLYEPLVALAACHLGRPVRLSLTRREDMLAGAPAPAMRIWVRLGANQSGDFTLLEASILYDVGCYPSHSMTIATTPFASIYRINNIAIDCAEVLTFKPSTGAYRAPGLPQVTFALESVVDELASALARDPLDLRIQNAAAAGDPMMHGEVWPSMGLQDVLRTLQAHPAWRQRHGDCRSRRGVGVAVGGCLSGSETAAAVCRLNRDGTFSVLTGAIDLTGTHTGLALLAAEALGTTVNDIQLVNGDLATTPYAGAASSSRTIYTVGPAVVAAAREAREQVLEIASEELEARVEDLEIVRGEIRVRGTSARTITLRDIAAKTMRSGYRYGRYAPVLGHGRAGDRPRTPCFCAELVEVEVDAETGVVRVVNLVVVQDVGRAINPLSIGGQMIGGAMQGLGLALFERLAYDKQGQLLTTTLLDYALPRAVDAPRQIETVIVEVPSEHGVFGVRGVGEPSIIPTAAAVANAIAAATGARYRDLPITPQRVLKALAGRGISRSQELTTFEASA